MAGDMFPKWIRGKVDLICRGPDLPSLINRAVHERIAVEDAAWVNGNQIRISVLLPDVFRFIRLAREEGAKVRIAGKRGWPFLMGRMRRRKAFVAGFAVFFLIIFLLSSFVWSVQIEGTDRIPAQQIRALLRREGVFEGQWKTRIPDPNHLKHRLMMQFPQASWVGIRLEGTRVVVTVAEKNRPEAPQTEFENKGPVHLVAKRDALIRDLRVERGNPLAEVGDLVRRGQVIVSGIYGDPSRPEGGKIAGAQGKVLGEVWYVSDVTAPLAAKRKVYTGNRFKREFPYMLGHVIRFSSEVPPFVRFETVSKIRRYSLGGWKLPLGWLEEEYLEMEWAEEKRTQRQAEAAGIAMARRELEEKLGRDGQILGEKVLHRRVENGKVYLKVHFDAIENIAIPQPILQGE